MLSVHTAREMIESAAAYDLIHRQAADGGPYTDDELVALASRMVGVTTAYQLVYDRARQEVLVGSDVVIGWAPNSGESGREQA